MMKRDGAVRKPGTGQRPTRLDALIAASLAFITLVLPLFTSLISTWPDVGLTIVTALALWQFRRWPHTALLVTGIAAAATMSGVFHFNLSGVGFILAVILFALYSTRLRTLIGAFVMTLVFALASSLPPIQSAASWPGLTSVLSIWPLFTLALGIQAIQTIRLARIERDRRVEEMRDEESQRRLVEERVHIAREIHDVIAHHVALAGVHAAVAQQKIEQGADQEAVETMQRIRTSTKTVLTELQSLLSVLRTEGQAAPIAPVPGVCDIPALVASFHGTGTQVAFQMSDDVPPLTPSADVAAYRLVQEALTNVQKHAPGSSATVEVVSHDGALDVMVTNSAPPETHVQVVEAVGFGLQGMNERIRAIGGWVDSRPTLEGGFQVRAVIPFGGANL